MDDDIAATQHLPRVDRTKDPFAMLQHLATKTSKSTPFVSALNQCASEEGATWVGGEACLGLAVPSRPVLKPLRLENDISTTEDLDFLSFCYSVHIIE